MDSRCRLIDSLNLNALWQDDFDEPLEVFERTVAKSIAEHDRAIGQL
jgi:hypothetical protein